MCLAVPGKIIRWIDRDPTFARAEVEFGGVSRICHMACVLDASLGDYVLVHAGVAITKIDEAEARRTLNDLATLDAFDDASEDSES
jgi:hydrogenase expression/formation protein HypC